MAENYSFANPGAVWNPQVQPYTDPRYYSSGGTGNHYYTGNTMPPPQPPVMPWFPKEPVVFGRDVPSIAGGYSGLGMLNQGGLSTHQLALLHGVTDQQELASQNQRLHKITSQNPNPPPPPQPYVTTTPRLPQAYQDLVTSGVKDQVANQKQTNLSFADYLKATGPEAKAAADARNRAYVTGQEKVTGDIAAANRANAGTTDATIAKMTAENARYEQGLRAATGQAIAAGAGGLNVGRVLDASAGGSGANMSGVGQDRSTSNSARYLLPQEAMLSNARRAQIWAENEMRNRLYGQTQALNERNSGLQQDYYGKDYAAQRQYIADLERRVSLGGQLTAQEISNVRGLMANFDAANWTDYNKPMDPNKLVTPMSFNTTAPNRGYAPQGPSNQGTPNPPVLNEPMDNRNYATSNAQMDANGYPVVYGQSNRHRLAKWINDQRALEGWLMDENGDYTINVSQTGYGNAPRYTAGDSGVWKVNENGGMIIPPGQG